MPAFSSFPILQLEPEAMYAALRQWNLADLVSFSLTSQLCARHVKNANVEIEPLNLEVNSEEIRIVLRRTNSKRSARWIITKVMPEVDFENRPPPPIFMNGRWVRCARLERTRNSVKIVPRVGFPFVTKYFAIQHTRALIQETISDVRFKTNNYRGSPQFWTNLPPFLQAYIDGENNQSTINFFLTRVTFSNTLCVEGSFCFLEDHFDRFYKSHEISLKVTSPWFKLKHLRSVECRKLTVYNANISDTDINKFINEWRGSELQQFESITLTPYEEHYDVQRIWRKPWKRLNVADCERYFVRLYEVTIQRTTDKSIMFIGLGLYKIEIQFTYPK